MLLEGSQIGPYTLIRKLGRGGFGEVWLAEKRSQFVTKRVAIKLPHEDQINFDSIHQEATLWEEASGHPNVLPIIDADIYDGQVIIVSEYASGGSLADKLKSEGRLPLRQAIETTIGVLSGLDFLHRKRIIHRDIKPQNILLQDDTPRLADFGISRAMQTTAISSTIIGTDAYMAPESFEGKRNVGTDIWSVGVVLYQLLKGSLPFPQEHPSERMFAVLTREFAPLPNDVSPDLKRIVQKALAKNPQERYQSAAEMREDLQRALVDINHPTFARTEVFQKPLAPVPSIETPHFQTNVQNTQTGERSIQTNVAAINLPLQPTIQVNQTAPQQHSIATQVKALQTGEISKSVLTKVQPLAIQVASFGNKNKILFYGSIFVVAAFLNLAILFGGSAIYRFYGFSGTRLIPYMKGGKFGLVDENKKFVVQPKYDLMDDFYDGIARVQLNGKMGYIDKLGNEITPIKYDTGSILENGYAIVATSNKYGVIDSSGKEILPTEYDKAMIFGEEGLCPLKKNEKSGYIDTNRLEVTPFKYDTADSFREGLAEVQIDGKYGFIDKTGKEVIPVKYEGVCNEYSAASLSVGDGLICAKQNGKFGYIDKTGKEVIPFKYDSAEHFADGRAVVYMLHGEGKEDDEKILIDKNGNEIAKLKYSFFIDFSEGLAVVGLGDDLNLKYGFIDKTGQEIIPVKYDMVDIFYKDGLAAVKLGNKWGYIDKTGKQIIPFKYDFARSFNNGLALVKLGEKFFYIDKNGTEYYEPEHSEH